MQRRLVRLTAIGLALMTALPALAHHGWRWTTGDNIELTGVIVEVQLGNPHGRVTVRAGDETWLVEVGQPWRNQSAGLEDGDLAPGVEAVFIGEPAADVSDKRLKAERLMIDGQLYDLYPDRD